MCERLQRFHSGGTTTCPPAATNTCSSNSASSPVDSSSGSCPRSDVQQDDDSSVVPQWKRELIARRKAMRAPRSGGLFAADIQQQIDGIKRVKEKEDDNLSDSSEEFKYGPGIVSKLKSKYLSLTLRETNGRQRPQLLPHLRRATSLENLLDDDRDNKPTTPISTPSSNDENKPRYIKNVKTTVNGGTSPTHSRRGVTRTKDVKRARSVEALMRHKTASDSEAISTTRFSLEERELPPPDLVKQTKKLFEPQQTPSQAPHPLVKSSSVPKGMSAITATTTTTTVGTINNNSNIKPAILPKPIRTTIEVVDMIVEATVIAAPAIPNKIEDKKVQEIKSKLFKENSRKVAKENLVKPVNPMKQVGVIRPIVTSTTTATNRIEFEKNLLNKGFVEQPVTKVIVSLKKSPEECTSPAQSQNVGVKPITWDPKKPNTMVFNFSDRKDVPDYIENDGLILASSRKNRDVVLLSGTTSDSSTDFDLDENFLTGPPSPCEVHVIGGNVLINGKSNLQKAPKLRKLRITFNDEATMRFEYPSESSLLEDSLQETDLANLGGMPLPLRSASLASYTPSKIAMSTADFELGVTKREMAAIGHNNNTSSGTNNNNHSINDIPFADDDDDGVAFLRPADDESTIAWSADTAADLLF